MTFKVEIRQDCKICGSDLSKRSRTYCSRECRNKGNYQKYSDYKRQYSKRYWEKNSGKYSPDKLQCKICKKWYIQLGTHIFSKHNLTAREYREEYDYPVKRGIVPSWYRQKKGNLAIKNKTYKNLEAGKKYRYKKGDIKAKRNTFWKGRLGSGRQALVKEIYGDFKKVE